MIGCLRASQAIWLLSIAAVLALTGCDLFGDKKRAWTEDVLLDDGTQIQIRRRVRFTDHNSLSGDAYGATDTEATLEILAAAKPLPTWNVPLMPLVLYRDAGEWVLVATTSSCEVWSSRGRSPSPYWEFRSRSDQWVETPLSASSIGRRSNLFFRYRQQVPPHVTVADKVAILSESRTHESYRSINTDPKLVGCQ